MSITDMDIQKIKKITSMLIEHKAWNASLGVGSFVTIEFGSKLPCNPKTKHEYGEWHLWIYCCVWRLEKKDDVIAGSEDPRSKLAEIIESLNGLTLTSVDITAPAFDTVFVFDQDVTLHLFSVSFLDESEHWMLYTPDGNVLTIGPGTTWSYESASKSEIL